MISELLQVTEADLKEALTGRVIAASGEVLRKVHKHKEAEFGLDAFAKVWSLCCIIKHLNQRKKIWCQIICLQSMYIYQVYYQTLSRSIYKLVYILRPIQSSSLNFELSFYFWFSLLSSVLYF